MYNEQTPFIAAVDQLFYWGRILHASEQHRDNGLSDVPTALSEITKAREAVLSVGHHEADRIRASGSDPSALIKFLALARMGGPWAEREPQLRALWVEASPLLDDPTASPGNINGEAPSGRAETPTPASTHTGPSAAELEKILRVHVAENQALYDRCKAAHDSGDSNATKVARKTFGRNHLAKKVCCVSGSRISNSVAWQKIRDELGLKQTQDSGRPTGQRVGLEIAEELAGKSRGDTTAMGAEHADLIAQVRAELPTAVAEEMIGKFQLGDMNATDVEFLLETYRDQESQKDHR